jgi:hypothetical protein
MQDIQVQARSDEVHMLKIQEKGSDQRSQINIQAIQE